MESYLWGYLRVTETDPEDTPSLERQKELFERAAKDIGLPVAPVVEDLQQAPYLKRQGFTGLMRDMESRDHLWVWGLDRIEPSLSGIIHVLHWLSNRQIALHVEKGPRKQPMELEPSAAGACTRPSNGMRSS